MYDVISWEFSQIKYLLEFVDDHLPLDLSSVALEAEIAYNTENLSDF